MTTAHCYRISQRRDWQTLAVEYLPLIVIAAVLIASRISQARRSRPKAALR